MSKGFLWNGIGTARASFQADREEYIRIGLLFAYLFCAASASTIGRTAADTLFLSHFDSSALSRMYLPQAVVLLLAGLIYQKLCKRTRIDLLCIWISLGVATLSLTSRLAAGLGYSWIYAVIYIAYDVFNFLMIVCFWQFATSVMDQRKAKKLINIVGSGSIVGGILSGFGLKLLVQPLGTLNLIVVYGGLQLFCFLLVRIILSRLPDRKELFSVSGSGSKPFGASPKKALHQSGGESMFTQVPHLKYIAIIAAAITLSLTFADYQFKVILRGSLQDEALAGFMGSFYGFAGLLALGVQLFLTGRVISNLGVMSSLLILPLALLAGSAGLLAAPIVAWAVVVKGSDKVLGDTIYSSVSQLIMFPIPPDYRARAKSFMDGIVRNGAKGLAAISLLALSPFLTIQQFSLAIILLLAIGATAAFRIKKAYMKLLMATLQTREADLLDGELDMMDAASLRALTDALQNEDKLQVLYALRILQSLNGFDLTPYLHGLLLHPSGEVRIEALKLIQQTTPDGVEQELEQFLSQGLPAEKAQALLALAAYGYEEQLERITSYLEDRSMEARVAAIAGLIKYYGVEGMFRSVGTIKELIDSGKEEHRIAMASLFGQIGIPSFYKPIIPLLSDSSPLVRIRALESAASLRVPELIPCIVPLLGHSTTRELAVEALAGYEEKVIEPRLELYLSSGPIADHIPKVYEQIGTQRAFDVLLRHYSSKEAEQRTPILEAMIRMNGSGCQASSSIVEPLIAEEASVYAALAEAENPLAASGPVYEEAAQAVKRVKLAAARRVFGLLSLLYDAPMIQAVYANWAYGDVRRQANAAEVVDQVLHGEMRALVARTMTLANMPPATKTPDPKTLSNRIMGLRLLNLGDPWLIACLEAAANGNVPVHASLEQVRLLRQVALFKGMWGIDLALIAQHLIPVHPPVGATIIREGEEGDSLFLLVSGQANVYARGTLVGRLQTGECFGEMALLTGGHRTATIVADGTLHLLRLDSAVLFEIMFNRTEIAMELMRMLSGRLRGALARAEEQSAAKQNSPALAAAEAAASASSAVDELTENLKEEELLVKEGRAKPKTAPSGAVDNQTILRRVLVLQKISLFTHFSQEDYIRLAKMVEEVPYRAGERICKTGEDGDSMHGIIEGKVRVHRGEAIFALLGVGEIFGEMSIIDNKPRSADCTAEEPTVLLKLTRETVLSFCFQNIDVLKGMLRVLAERLKGLQE